MSRVITFSRTFPAYHPKRGCNTDFVLQLLRSVKNPQASLFDHPNIYELVPGIETETAVYWESGNYPAKHHTIRAGNRWKVGDKFSPRVWSGKPYNSKQIVIAPDIEILKVWDFEMFPAAWIDECRFMVGSGHITNIEQLRPIATNDGLDLSDFIDWFTGGDLRNSNRKPFKGQIICWSDSVNY